MAQMPREVEVRITADTSQFEAAMNRASIIASRVARQMCGGWRPSSWYATSERTPR